MAETVGVINKFKVSVDTSVSELANILLKDCALTTTILKVVNSVISCSPARSPRYCARSSSWASSTSHKKHPRKFVNNCLITQDFWHVVRRNIVRDISTTASGTTIRHSPPKNISSRNKIPGRRWKFDVRGNRTWGVTSKNSHSRQKLCRYRTRKSISVRLPSGLVS